MNPAGNAHFSHNVKKKTTAEMSHGASNSHRIRNNEIHDGSCQTHWLCSRSAGQIELFLSWSKVYFSGFRQLC